MSVYLPRLSLACNMAATLYVKRVSAQGDVGSYVAVEGVDLAQSASAFTKLWIRECAPDVLSSLVQLRLAPADGQEESATLDGRVSLAAAGVGDLQSLLAYVSSPSAGARARGHVSAPGRSPALDRLLVQQPE